MVYSIADEWCCIVQQSVCGVWFYIVACGQGNAREKLCDVAHRDVVVMLC